MSTAGSTGSPFAGEAFAVKDCALAAIATGKRAQNLKELRDQLLTIDSASIYYHFWGALLRPTFDDPEYNNDFAAWVRHGLHEPALAERLSVIDPTDFEDIEALRYEVVEVIESHLDSLETIPWTRTDQQFHFIRSQIVVFSTNQTLTDPEELVRAVAGMSAGSIFYHFVDARRRTPGGMDDFRTWLTDFGGRYAELCDVLAAVDPFFPTLHDLRQQLVSALAHFFGGERA